MGICEVAEELPGLPEELADELPEVLDELPELLDELPDELLELLGLEDIILKGGRSEVPG